MVTFDRFYPGQYKTVYTGQFHRSIQLNKESNKLNVIQQELYDWVKTKGTFKRAEIQPLATSLGIKQRTLTDLLNKLIDKKLIKRIKHGEYSQT